MPNKSFEEQVREELSGLRIKPNDAVWETVAASLQQKRKRRWAIWLLTLLVGLSGASFWLLLEPSSQTLISSKSIHSDSAQQKIPKVGNSAIKESTKGSSNVSEEEKLDYKGTSLKKKESSVPISTSIKLEASTKQQKDNIQKELIQSSVLVNDITTSASSKQLNTVQPLSPVSTTKKDSGLIIHEIVGISETASIGQLQYDTATSVSIDTQKKADKQKKAPHWKWRFAVQGGKSGIRNSLGSLLSSTTADSYSGFFSNANPNSPQTGTASLFPSRIQSKDHFSAGISIEMIRTIGKKKKNSIGLQLGYDLYQTRTRIGNINSGTLQFSNVNRSNEAAVYYGVNDSANYIASYHFIRLGVNFYRSLNWIRKVNLRWYGGIGSNTMISGNGLHLGTANNNIYYFKNRSLLQTVQLDFSSGFEMALGKQKRLFVAPQVQYMLSNLSKQAGVNQHLFRPSIKLSWQLSKNVP